MTDQLLKCGRCQCKKLPEFFPVKPTTGIRAKTCSQCHDRFKCPQCDYKCSKNANLKTHIKMVHDKIRDIKCPTCDYTCCANSTLQRHVKQIHDKIKDIKCQTCEYRCSTNSNLKAHIKQVHDKVKDYACPTCDYVCSANTTLQRHIKMIHMKVKDHACPTCEYRFSTNSNLKTHIKMVHTKIKDHACPTCSYTCSTNSDLQRHIKVCTGSFSGSSGEYAVSQALDSLGVKYAREVSIVKNAEGNWLRFDFQIQTDNDPIFIEYDGIQHFEPVRFNSITHEEAQAALEKLQLHDKQKNEYCEKEGLRLLRIPYTDKHRSHDLIKDFLQV